MKKLIITFCAIIVLLILVTNIWGKGWIFFHDGPYRGKVVDAETGQPIEGAAVIGMWKLETYGGPGGPVGVYCDAQEAITDKNGEFTVPKAFCFNLWPFTKIGMAEFVIFKPGFDSYPPRLPVVKQPFSEKDMVEKHKYQLEYWVVIEKNKDNLIKLKKAKNKEEREWIVTSISISTIPYEEQPKQAVQMINLIKREERYLGL